MLVLFFMYNPYLIRDIIIFEPQNHELSGEINLKMCIIEKSKKNIAKNL